MIALLLDSRQMGGIESHVLNLAQALTRRGYKVQVVLWKDYGDHPLVDALRAQAIEVVHLQGRVRSLMHYLTQAAPHILHTHGYKAGIWGRLVARILGISVVSTFHNGDVGVGRMALYTALDRLLAGFSHNICVSDQIASRLFWPSRVLANFIEDSQLSAQPRQRFGRRIGFVGRLTHDKGPDRFYTLASNMPDAQFLVYGMGELLPTQTTLLANLKLMGSVASMSEHWANLDLLCIPSRVEGLPMVALEAMARGIYVVAFDVGDLHKVITPSGGALVKAGDLAAMQQAIEDWLASSDTQKKKLSAQAIHYIQSHHTSQSALEPVLSVYHAAGLPCCNH